MEKLHVKSKVGMDVMKKLSLVIMYFDAYNELIGSVIV